MKGKKEKKTILFTKVTLYTNIYCGTDKLVAIGTVDFGEEGKQENPERLTETQHMQLAISKLLFACFKACEPLCSFIQIK